MSVEMEMHIDGIPELREKLNRLDEGMKRNVQEAMQFEADAIIESVLNEEKKLTSIIEKLKK